MQEKKLPAKRAEKKPIPYLDAEIAKVRKEYLERINVEPRSEWIKELEGASFKKNGVWVPVRYIPIERLEWLRDQLFLASKTKVKKVQFIANAVVVTVRVKLLNPVTMEWESHDGVGGAPLNTKKGCGAIDWQNILHNAVQLAAPAAETFAIKDALEKFGKVFGRDLNRADEVLYGSKGNTENNEPLNQ